MANIISSGATSVMYYSPPRKLKNSIASNASDGGAANFPAEAAGIPDNFATTESPKLKFLFSVQFFPRGSLALPDNGSTDMNSLIFALKRATRPNVSMTYQNVNMYNYRSQVLTKIEYGGTPATLAFYDDVTSRSLGIIVNYLNLISPISNQPITAASTLATDIDGSSSVGPLDPSSSSVPIAGSEYGPLEAIRVAHHSFDPNNPQNLISTFYDYLNPKIVNISLDELDMSTSDVSLVEFSFMYDAVNITLPQSQTFGSINPTTSVGNLTQVPSPQG
jgi:hypothetical protein